jgi:hypothetical protein
MSAPCVYVLYQIGSPETWHVPSLDVENLPADLKPGQYGVDVIYEEPSGMYSNWRWGALVKHEDGRVETISGSGPSLGQSALRLARCLLALF